MNARYTLGYLSMMERLDARGEGVACGKSWISPGKKCSKGKSATTSKESLERTKEKAKERQKLRQEIKNNKGKKPYMKPQEAESIQLQPLTVGTEKQIAYADKIRKEKMGFIEKRIQTSGIPVTTSEVNTVLGQQTNSKFWLDNQDTSATGMLLYVAAKSGKPMKGLKVNESIVTRTNPGKENETVSEQKYQSQVIALSQGKNGLKPESMKGIHLVLPLEGGDLKATKEKPSPEEALASWEPEKVLNRNKAGWLAKSPNYAFLRYSKGEWKIDTVKDYYP